MASAAIVLLHAEAGWLRRRRACADCSASDEAVVRAAAQLDAGMAPAYKRIDTCAAEFESFTPYMYGTYEPFCESDPNAEEEGRHPRQRPQPHRPGHRVRLLLLSRRLRASAKRASRR